MDRKVSIGVEPKKYFRACQSDLIIRVTYFSSCQLKSTKCIPLICICTYVKYYRFLSPEYYQTTRGHFFLTVEISVTPSRHFKFNLTTTIYTTFYNPLRKLKKKDFFTKFKLLLECIRGLQVEIEN
jgi:hypothetical protein